MQLTTTLLKPLRIPQSRYFLAQYSTSIRFIAYCEHRQNNNNQTHGKTIYSRKLENYDHTMLTNKQEAVTALL